MRITSVAGRLGDIFACRVGYSCEKKDEDGNRVAAPAPIALARLTDMVANCLAEIGTKKYKIFLTGPNNFRKQVSETYKANRKPEDKPILLPELEDYLITKWGAERAAGEEADDRLGIYQTMYAENGGDDTVIASIDKDLKQIPGQHYDFVKMEWDDVTEEQGTYWFYRQLLTGDSTDNISGCPGIGPKKAEKILTQYIGDELLMYKAVYETYVAKFPQLSPEELGELITTVGRLVYIRRHNGEMWVPPKEIT